MFKSAIAALAASPLLASAALAGPYVNVENNAGWSGDDYNGAVTDLHVGYEGTIGENGSFYLQGGPAIVAEDGEENATEISGKVGASVAVTESTSIYGELSAITVDQEITDGLSVGSKIGVKYSF